MLTVMGLDPGYLNSALVCFNGETVTQHEDLPNDVLLERLAYYKDHGTDQILVIEQIESFGMAVGKEVFETVFWSGRFAQAWTPKRVQRLPRRLVKVHLCHSARATDANIRQALIDRFGPTPEKAIGKKKAPGPLFGVTGHKLAALAVAITWFDQEGHLPQEIRPGVRSDF